MLLDLLRCRWGHQDKESPSAVRRAGAAWLVVWQKQALIFPPLEETPAPYDSFQRWPNVGSKRGKTPLFCTYPLFAPTRGISALLMYEFLACMILYPGSLRTIYRETLRRYHIRVHCLLMSEPTVCAGTDKVLVFIFIAVPLILLDRGYCTSIQLPFVVFLEMKASSNDPFKNKYPSASLRGLFHGSALNRLILSWFNQQKDDPNKYALPRCLSLTFLLGLHQKTYHEQVHFTSHQK